MNSNLHYAYALMNEEIPTETGVPTTPDGQQRVRFRLKKGDMSLSATVSVDYFDTMVLPILTRLLGNIGERAERTAGKVDEDDPAPVTPNFRSGQRPSMREIVEALGARSGPELLRAAAVSLSVFQQMPIFSCEQLLGEAEKAVGHWHKTHSKTANEVLDYLKSSGCLVEQASGDLCLNPAEEKSAILAMRVSNS